MPITLPADLPAYNVLQREGGMVMADDRATRQDIRPLRIGLRLRARLLYCDANGDWRF